MDAPYISSKQYTAVFNQVMVYWGRWHEEYVTLIPEYKKLMKEKRRRHIEPLRTINKTTLSEFPKIRFLEIQAWDTAEEYLLELSYRELKYLMTQLEEYEYNHVRRSLKIWIADTKLMLRPRRKKSPLGIDPNYNKKGTPVQRNGHHLSIYDV